MAALSLYAGGKQMSSKFGVAEWIVVVLVGAVAIAGLGQAPWGTANADIASKFAMPVVTVGVVLVAWLAYRMNRQAARSTRIKDAATLLKEDSDAVKIVAIEALRDLVAEDDRYLPAAFLALANLIREIGEALLPGERVNEFWRNTNWDRSTPRGGPVISAALGAMD